MNGYSTSSGDRPTALVTGASSGIGQVVAAHFVERGAHVLGTCRDPDRLDEANRVAGVRYLPLDVTDPDSVAACAERTGPVDILVNNAGQSQLGPLEDLADSSIENLFAVNVFGPVRLVRAYLPGMRAARRGAIVMVGSLMAEFPLPYQSTYAATKAALRAFTQSVRFEVAPFGVRVSVVQPSYFRSDINQRRERVIRPESAYAGPLSAVVRSIDGAHAQAGDPREVARLIWRVANDRDPAPVYSIGANASGQLLAKRLLSGRRVERLVARRYEPTLTTISPESEQA